MNSHIHPLEPTVLVISTHGCSHHIHGDLLAARALRQPGDHRLLYLPMSEPPHGSDELGAQRFSSDRMVRYFDRFSARGLEAHTFYWSRSMRHNEASQLFRMVEEVPVLLLGSGVSPLGLMRYRALGKAFWGDEHLFAKLLQRRMRRGLLTAGTSAGAKQLGALFGVRGTHEGPFWDALGLAADIAVEVHHDWRQQQALKRAAAKRRRCLWFGLPNDSALTVSTGRLQSGASWQMVRCVIDTTHDVPEDQWHVKTRQGMKIDHYYSDGRHWAFNHGDGLLRLRRRGSRHFKAVWLESCGQVFDYRSQQKVPARSLEQMLELSR